MGGGEETKSTHTPPPDLRIYILYLVYVTGLGLFEGKQDVVF